MDVSNGKLSSVIALVGRAAQDQFGEPCKGRISEEEVRPSSTSQSKTRVFTQPMSHTRRVSIRNLRLVCKELCRSAMTLVRYAEVHLGRDGDFPSVQQLVGLLKEACLDEIKIIVTLWSGKPGLHPATH